MRHGAFGTAKGLCDKFCSRYFKDMRIRLLLWHWGRRGGGPQFTLGLARALLLRDDIDLSLSVSGQSELLRAFLELRCPIQIVDTYVSLGSFVTSLPRLPAIVHRFVAQAKGHDVVLSGMTHLWTPFAAPALARAGIPFVPVVHDATPHPGDFAFAWDWRLRRELGAARASVALSDTVARSLVELAPGLPVVRIPLLGSLAAGPPVDRMPGTGRFLFFGRLRAYKGLDLLRDAFQLLHRQYPGVSLRVVGEGDIDGCAPGLRDLPGVTVDPRWVSEADIPAVLGAADVVVLPYREASQSGIVPQALACGVPIVATPVGGLTEQVLPGRGGILATTITPRALSNAMAETLEPGVIERLRREALEAGKAAIDWESAAERLVAGLRSILSAGVTCSP